MNVAADRVLMVLSASRCGRNDELGVTELSDQLRLDDLRTRLRRVKLAQVTDSTVTSVDDLLQELEVALRAGYALNHGEYMPGVAGVGGAVRDRDRSSIAGISVAFPMLPSFAGLLEILPAEVRGVAEEIRRQLHGTRTLLESKWRAPEPV